MEDQHDSATDGREGEGSGFIRKTGIAVAGGAVTLAGLVMLVTPGPGVIVTMAGLGILSREFDFARRRLQSLRRRTNPAAEGDES